MNRSHTQAKTNFIKEAITEAQGKPTLITIFFLSTFLLTVHGIYGEYVPPLLQLHGFGLSTIAFLATIVFSAQAAGQYLSDSLTGMSYRKQLSLVALGAACLIPGTLSDTWLSVFFVSVFFFVFGLTGTLIETHLQHSIEGDARATVTSIIGVGDSLGAIIWFLLFGLVAEYYSIIGATLALSIVTLCLCLVANQYQFETKR